MVRKGDLPASQPVHETLNERSGLSKRSEKRITFFNVSYPMTQSHNLSRVACDRRERKVVGKAVKVCLLGFIEEVS